MPSLSTLDPSLRPNAEAFFKKARAFVGGGLVVTSARRSIQEQERLYNAYLRGQNNGLPAAPPGTSDHELGLAWDMARLNRDPFQDELLRVLGSAWIRLWGGRWTPKDPVHFAAPRQHRIR